LCAEQRGLTRPKCGRYRLATGAAILVESPPPPRATEGRASASAKFELPAASSHRTGHEFRMLVFDRPGYGLGRNISDIVQGDGPIMGGREALEDVHAVRD